VFLSGPCWGVVLKTTGATRSFLWREELSSWSWRIYTVKRHNTLENLVGSVMIWKLWRLAVEPWLLVVPCRVYKWSGNPISNLNPAYDVTVLLYILHMFRYTQSSSGPRGSLVGWGTMLQAGRSRVRVPMRWNFSNLLNPSSRTMALEPTQTVREMSTRNLPVGLRAAGA
jgi:hypothetical protein